MSLLVDGQRFITITYYYLEFQKQLGNITISNFKFLNTKEMYEKHKNDPNLKVLNTGWSIPDWSQQQMLLRQSTVYETLPDGTPNARIDFLKLQDMTLRTFLKTWDLKEKDVLVPLDGDTIGRLHPIVAKELLEGYEAITSVKENDLKNS